MKLGNVATGADFFNRVTDLTNIWGNLENDHLILSGPRRLGKSSILYKLKEQATAHGYQAEIIDVQGVDSAKGFIDCLGEGFPTKTHPVASILTSINPLRRVKKVEAKVLGTGASLELKDIEQKHWQDNGNKIRDQLSAKKHLILIDEFSVFLEKMLQRNATEAVDFLDWLRSWRINQNAQCTFVFTGSIGLTTLLETHQLLPQMNDCNEYVLSQFKQVHAVQMLHKFASDNNWAISEQSAKYLCNRIGWLSPFFLNLLLNESICAARDRLLEQPAATEKLADVSEAIIDQDIDDGYERLLTSRSRFSHWESRLEKQLPMHDFSFCKAILSLIAKAEAGMNMTQLSTRLQPLQADQEQREQILQKLLFRLTEEGYLSSPDQQGEIQFLSFLLKDYWKRNHA
jgi:hypothetical protein